MSNLTTTTSKAVMSPEDIQVMKDSMFKGFSDSEVKFCVAVSQQLALSPLLRQVHFVKRYDNKLKRDVVTPQTGIDGFRLIAERTNKYAGSDEPFFEYEGTNKKQPVKASVTVWKLVDGTRVPFTASARWDEFYPGDTMGFMWRSKPHVMLGKCAESQALRKAFPGELSSVYSEEEMVREDQPVERKADRIQEKVLRVEATPVETEATPVETSEHPVEEIQNKDPMYELFSYPIPGDKYKGKVLGDLASDELSNFVVSTQKWFADEKKPIKGKWQEFFQKAEAYLNEVGETQGELK